MWVLQVAVNQFSAMIQKEKPVQRIHTKLRGTYCARLNYCRNDNSRCCSDDFGNYGLRDLKAMSIIVNEGENPTATYSRGRRGSGPQSCRNCRI